MNYELEPITYQASTSLPAEPASGYNPPGEHAERNKKRRERQARDGQLKDLNKQKVAAAKADKKAALQATREIKMLHAELGTLKKLARATGTTVKDMFASPEIRARLIARLAAGQTLIGALGAIV